MSLRKRQLVLGQVKKLTVVLADKRHKMIVVDADEYDDEIREARALIADAVILMCVTCGWLSTNPQVREEAWFPLVQTWLRYANEMMYLNEGESAPPLKADQYEETLRKLSASVRRAWDTRKPRSNVSRGNTGKSRSS